MLHFCNIVREVGRGWWKQLPWTASQTPLRVCFSCGVSDVSIRLPVWMCVVSGRLQQDTRRGPWPHGEGQPSPEILIEQIFIEQFYSDVGLRKTSLTIR